MMNDRLRMVMAVLVLSVGCGGSGDMKTVHEVTGKLTLDGAPFGPVTIMLVDRNKEKPKSVHGQVDKDGNVTFTTYDVGDGAPAGSYSVVVGMEMSPPPKPFPNIYRDAEGSPLMVEIKPEDGAEVVMAMDSKIGGPMYTGPSFGKKGGGPDLSAANAGLVGDTKEDE